MSGIVNRIIIEGLRSGQSKTQIRREIKKLKINVGMHAFNTRYGLLKSYVGQTFKKDQGSSSKDHKRK
mgnify:CR=1 FL=1